MLLPANDVIDQLVFQLASTSIELLLFHPTLSAKLLVFFHVLHAVIFVMFELDIRIRQSDYIPALVLGKS